MRSAGKDKRAKERKSRREEVVRQSGRGEGGKEI